MCRYGLRIPSSDIRKATRLLVTHDNMRFLAKECPGSCQSQHVCHQTIAGSDPVVDRIDTFAGKYTPNVVESVMETVPRYAVLKQECLAACSPWSCKQQDEVLAAKPGLSVEKTDDELLRVIDKVHKNLGHPPTQDLVRIFKHAKASDRAIQLALLPVAD